MKGFKIFIGIMITLIVIVLSFVGWDKYRQYKAEKLVEQYYTALKNENYNQALDYLVAYQGPVEQRIEMDQVKAKEIYQKGIDFLKQMNYKLIDYKINMGKNDFIITASASIKVQCDGKTIEGSESLQFTPALDKLFIDYSDDPFAQYRDGYMEFYDVNYQGKQAIKLMIEKAEIFHGFGQTASDGGSYITAGKSLSEFVHAIDKSQKVQEKIDLNKPNYMVRVEFTKNKHMDMKFWVSKERTLFIINEAPNTVYTIPKESLTAVNEFFEFVEWKYKGTVPGK